MKHIDAAGHTRGESQYVDDMPQPVGMLHAAIFLSPVAHGRITALALEVAAKCEGVVAVYSAKDIPGENQIGALIPDESLLAEEEVHFIGEPVAMVVAESFEQAHKALKKIKLDVQEQER